VIRRRWRRRLAAAIVVLVGVGAAVGFLVGRGGGGPRPAATPVGAPTTRAAPTTSTASPSPPLAVGVTRGLFVDPSRSTPARGPTPAASNRPLRVTIRYPISGPAGASETADASSAAGTFPLVVFAHGFELSDATYPRFLHDLAAEGFVVADPEFPLSSAALPGPPVSGDEPAQARDLSFVADRLLDPVTRPAPLAAWRPGASIAAVGHSDGGATVAGLAGSGCCADGRVAAAVSLAGALAHFPGPWFAGPSPPLLVVHGDADEVNPLGASATLYDAARPPKLFAVVHGGTHIDAFESDASRPAVVRLVADFLRAHVLLDPGAAARLGADASVPGVLELRASA
jgi:alpha-beta hydrolase superfamily lysophospholipase